MKNKTIVITGASDGIGAEAARQLHSMGATVVVVGRSPDKTKKIADEIKSPYFIADFSKFEDVRKLASDLRNNFPKIDVLVNNAGGIFGDRELTVDGHEKTLQVNHLSHFLLTNLLMDILVDSGASVINTSSVANERFADFDVHDLELVKGYSPNRAYGNSKLANILFTKELHNRYHQKGISSVAFHPGNVSTSFASDTTSWFRFVYKTALAKLILISPAQGADTLVWLATGNAEVDWISGEYYEKRKIVKANEQAYDSALARELWDMSEIYVKFK
jgi:NAD(P)-dependent dehydrogenase (short-subunit alcohol dehydrogenase family)